MDNWAFNLDMLAQNGIIDFDAPSYIKGLPPRYVGNPVNPTPFNDYVPKGTNLGQPQNDGFEKNDTNPIKNPLWKKLAFGALAVGALAVGGYKFRSKLIPWAKTGWQKVTNAFKFTSVKNFFKNGWDKTKNFVKGGWNKTVNFVKNGFNKVKSKINFPAIKQFVIDKAKAVGNFFKTIWHKIFP